MGSPPGRSTLNRFYLFYVSVGVGRPYRGGVFQLWSDKCFVGCGLVRMWKFVEDKIYYKT